MQQRSQLKEAMSYSAWVSDSKEQVYLCPCLQLGCHALVQTELQVHCFVMLIVPYVHRLQASSEAVLACGGSCVSLLLSLKVDAYLLLQYSWLKPSAPSGIW